MGISMREEYTPPSYKEEGFHCPYCGVYAHQDWYEVSLERDSEPESAEGLSLSYCGRCDNYAVWIKENLVYPERSIAPMPPVDMPEDIMRDYLEARKIIDRSPRSASALLRRALRRLIMHLGESGENIEDAINNLNKKGLDIKLQKALNTVRMTGDEAIAPGLIDDRDDEETTIILFNIINIIVDALISQPRMVDDLLEKLPNSKKRNKDFLFRAKLK
jgi:hypothetical protein